MIWGQVGYPVAAFVQWVWINRFATDLDKWAGKPNAKNHMPPDQYSRLLSVTKDVTYAVLDAAQYDPLAVGVKLTVGESCWHGRAKSVCYSTFRGCDAVCHDPTDGDQV